jgi:uncharacterized protein (TIGR02284 family)
MEDDDMAMDRDAVVGTLNDLIEICRDGEEGFRLCAEKVDDAELKGLFREWSTQRAGFATELQSEVERLGDNARERSEAKGLLHRGWMNLRSALEGGDAHGLLSEAERGEDAAKDAYEKALAQALPTDVKEMVERQYGDVKRTHDRVRDLRDQKRGGRAA